LAFSVVMQDSTVIPIVVVPVLFASLPSKQDYELTACGRRDTTLHLTAQSAVNFLPTVVKGADFVRKVTDRLEPIHRESMIPGRLTLLEGCVH
jgi:hypothetical protein